MKKIRNILLPIVAAIITLAATFGLSPTAAAAPGSWRIHPSFDNDPQRVIATPFGAWLFALAQTYNPKQNDYAERQGFIYRYDTDADEFRFLSTTDGLAENVVSTVEYNPKAGYLLVVYTNGNIDLVYDDGDIVNIPGLKIAAVTGSKLINDISFDYDRNRAWLAADFGYLVINDAKGEVERSFIVNEPVQSVVRAGDTVFMLKDGKVFTADATRPQYSMADFTCSLELDGVTRLLSSGADRVIARTGEASPYVYHLVSGDRDSKFGLSRITESNRAETEYSDSGLLVQSGAQFILISPDGAVTSTVTRQDDDFNTLGSSRDMKEFWYVRGREGLYTKRYDAQGGSKWTVTRQPMMPDAASAFKSNAMAWHPGYGMLVSNHGIDLNFHSYNVRTPILLSALDGGRWERLGLPYTNPAQQSVLSNPNGLAIDPDNSDLIYFGSLLNGIVRINLADPQDVLHMASPYDPGKNLPGYVQMGDGNLWWPEHFKFSAPRFDADGNLWSGYYNSQAEQDKKKQVEIWYWPSADRKASRNAASFRPWKKWVIEGFASSQRDIVYPLKASANRNIVLYVSNDYGSPIFVIDHKGTLDDRSDDEMVRLENFSNQDGTSFLLERVGCFYEDPNTGTVWVGTTTGLFTFSPQQVFKDSGHVTQIKVSRDDGTDLADYLLNGSGINDITADNLGRKWFSLNGGGIVITSADGRRVLLELTAEDTPLPSDQVYTMAYNPDANSMMISTSDGLAEYFPSGEGATGEDLDNVRCYPNPVRSDYYGYVTIDGLVEGALVKIVDAHGNLVREFPLAEGGEVKWNVTNLANKRVKTGVYYVLSSSGPGGTGLANVGKILVVN